jgi:hypothetical protein
MVLLFLHISHRKREGSINCGCVDKVKPSVPPVGDLEKVAIGFFV